MRPTGQLGLDAKTVGKYPAVFEHLFLLQRLSPWSHHALQRIVKTPKLHFNVAGLLAALAGLTAPRLDAERARLGPLLETFVFGELRKLMSWQEQPPHLFHYRDKDQDEVDFVLENMQGQVIGLEVKVAATVTGGDFKGMRKLAAALGRSFQLGLVLYDGEDVLPFGERLVAAPLSCLWSGV